MTSSVGSKHESAVQPAFISAATAHLVTGMSWQWCVRFARANGVSLVRVSARKQLLPYSDFVTAMQQAAVNKTPPRVLSEDERVNQLLRKVGFELAR